MRPILLFFLLSLIGGGTTQALGQEDSKTIRHHKEAAVPWLTHLYARSKKTRTVAGLDQKSALVIRNSLDYHQALVKRDLKTIRFRTSNYLRYVHSNGWVETKEEQLQNIANGYLVYHSFQEDSMTVSCLYDDFTNYIFTSPTTKVTCQYQLNFYATVDVTLNGKRNTYRLKVTEVWAAIPGGRKGSYLICRKATKP